ncbi:TonB-dependent receptor [Acinetobacter puyangensis]|uniref:TonB-dependent receptor n=1 Tax=Acinetobacter puyangensis TaxID=1096779 RepID=UPI003A4D944B
MSDLNSKQRIYLNKIQNEPEFWKLNKLRLSILFSIGILNGFSVVYADDTQKLSNTQKIKLTQSSVKQDPVIQLDPVVVTARRREEKAQDVPTPISILSPKTLETQRISRVEELQQALPSINVALQNPRQSSIAIRGLGNNLASDGLEASAGVYLDNVYLGRPGMAVFDMLDIAQLELLRGPQGTLFGKNTTAGLLNISSKAPTFYSDNTLEISAGERNYFQTKGSFSHALSNTVAGRLSFYKTIQDGFIYNVYNGDKLNNTDRQGLRGQLLWQPDDSISVRWIADYNKQDDSQGTPLIYSKGPIFNHPIYGANYNRYTDNTRQAGVSFEDDNIYSKKTASDASKRMFVEQGGSSVEANWTLDNGNKLTSISAYRIWNFTPTNSDNTVADATRNIGVAVRDKQYSQEFRLSSEKNANFDWVTGLYYFQQNIKNHAYTYYGADADTVMLYHNSALREDISNHATHILNDRSSHTYGYADTKSYAAFGQGTWHVTPKLDLTAGARLTYEDKAARIVRLAPIGGVEISTLPLVQQNSVRAQLGAYDSAKLKISDTGYAGILTASYQLQPESLLYAIYSHGEKSGGFNLAVGSAPSAGAESLKVKPERADNYEIGLKQNLFDNRLQLNSNLFWVNVTDYQTTGTQLLDNGTYTTILGNAGKVQSRGIEIDATAQPIKGLTLNFNGSLNDTRYQSYKNAPVSAFASIVTAANSQDLTGQRVYGVPKWSANFNFRYDLADYQGWQPYVSGSYAWRDWSYGNLDNSKESIIKSYGLINASFGGRHQIADHAVDVSLWIKNLTDKTYVTNVEGFMLGSYNAYLGQPRTIGASLKLQF